MDTGYGAYNVINFRSVQEYQDKLKETYVRVKEREAGELEEEWGLMKESLVGHASDVCGKRFVGGCNEEGQ